MARLPADVQQELRNLRVMFQNGDLVGFSAAEIYRQTRATLSERGIDLGVLLCNFRRFLNGEQIA